MGLMQEGLRRTLGTGEIRNTLHPANLNPSEIKVSKLPARDRLESRATELLNLILGEKDKAGHAEEPKLKREDGFEPFVNGYNGNFTQRMELNRKGIERVLRIAHLEGQVFLTTLSPNRQRSIEANPDGSVSAKRFLFFGQKTEEDGKDNPLSRVVAVPQGWKIEINDGKILEDLNEKGLTGEKRQTAFIKKFSQLLNKSLFECILKEKMTSIKDEHFRGKVFLTVINPATGLFVFAPKLLQLDLFAITTLPLAILTVNALTNLSMLRRKRSIERQNNTNSAYVARKLDAPWEYLMPQVEIDKVARSAVFLAFKGRTLVKEKNLNT